jgi:alcohol dehydrogenase YqhD (iron-dependent ADH family)
MPIYQLLEILDKISTTNSIHMLRKMLAELEEAAEAQLIQIDMATGAAAINELEDYYAFNDVLWALRKAIKLRIKSREEAWVRVEGNATIV